MRVFLLLALLGLNASAQDFKLPVEIRHTREPAYVPADGKFLSLLELELINHYEAAPVGIDSIEVLDGALQPLAAYRGAAIRALNQSTPADGAYPLAPSHYEAFFLDVSAPQAPDTLRYRIRFAVGAPEKARIMEFVSEPIAVRPADVHMAFPLPDARWAAINGPGILSEHRTQSVYLNGERHLSQRYAYDFVGLDRRGRLHDGKGEQAGQWHGFGQPVTAGIRGRVAQVFTGFDDNPKVGEVDAANRRSPCGNGVVVEVSPQRFLSYCHLRRGSVTLVPGAAVEPATVIGQVGNSGNSDAPHLHLHLSDRPEPLKGEGFPIRFDDAARYGQVADFDALAAGRIEWLKAPATVEGAVRGNTVVGRRK